MADALSVTTNPDRKTRLIDEINETLPANRPLIIKALLSQGSTSRFTPAIASDINTNDASADPNKVYSLARIVECADANQTYWRSNNTCQENGLVAFADYTAYPDKTMYFKDDTLPINTADNYYDISSKITGTYNISATGNP